ncbi:hypothetical protein ACFL5O_10405 [Myxococcota bacterium]
MEDLVVAGQVVAGTAAARKATVQLFDELTSSGLNPELVQTVTTDQDGRFAFKPVADDHNSFDRVAWSQIAPDDDSPDVQEKLPAFGRSSGNGLRWASVDISELLPEAELGHQRPAQLAVVPITTDGVKTPIDSAQVLTIRDEILVGASGLSTLSYTQPMGCSSNAARLGFDLDPTEDVSTSAAPSLSPISEAAQLIGEP